MNKYVYLAIFLVINISFHLIFGSVKEGLWMKGPIKILSNKEEEEESSWTPSQSNCCIYNGGYKRKSGLTYSQMGDCDSNGWCKIRPYEMSSKELCTSSGRVWHNAMDGKCISSATPPSQLDISNECKQERTITWFGWGGGATIFSNNLDTEKKQACVKEGRKKLENNWKPLELNITKTGCKNKIYNGQQTFFIPGKKARCCSKDGCAIDNVYPSPPSTNSDCLTGIGEGCIRQ